MKTSAGLLLGLLALGAARASADPSLDRAVQAEKAGRADIAASAYQQWLQANPSSADAPDVFASYYRVEQDLPALLRESRDFVAAAKGVPGAAAQFVRIARLFELAGLTEEARDAWLAAAAEGAQGSALVSAALLSLELNDADALGRIRTLAAGGPFAAIVSALAAVQAGDYAAAREGLATAARGDPEVVLKALWVLSRASRAAGDAPTAAFAAGELAGRYARSPEAAMVPGGRPVDADAARPLVSPTGFEMLGMSFPPANPAGTATGPSESAPAPAAPSASDSATPGPAAGTTGTFAVQAGAFQVRENADYLAADLRAKGFDPMVRQDSWQGRDRFRVLAGVGLTRDGASVLLEKLTRAGYSGFLTADPAAGG